MVRSELVVSFIATTTLVAGSAIRMTMMKGTMVQAISTFTLSWKFADTAPLDFRCLKIE